MVICIQRKKRKKKSSGVHCPVTKKLEALITRYMSPTHRSFLLPRWLCASIPAPDPPPRPKASCTELKLCCQGWFKTVTCKGKQNQTRASTFEKPVRVCAPRGNGVIGSLP